jgi:hypothetical protein
MSLPASMKHLLNNALKHGGLTFTQAQEALSLLSSDDIITACDACASLLIGGGPLDMPHLVANCVRLYALAHDRAPGRANILFSLSNDALDILDYPEIRQLVLDAGSSGDPHFGDQRCSLAPDIGSQRRRGGCSNHTKVG